jgi:hypothetical protein
MIKPQTVERWDWEAEHHTPGVPELSAQHREYLRLCDEQYDAEHDPIDHRIWQPLLRMLSHNIRKRRGFRIVLARVTWLTEEPTWIPLSSLKRDSPFLIIDYVMRKPELMRIPDFHWVCTYVDNAPQLQHVHNVFKATTSERQPKIKFGVEVPYSIHHALQLDQRAGNNLWKEAIDKELIQLNEYKTFRLRRSGEDLSEYTRIPYHCVFDVKFDGRRKCRLVAGGNHTSPSKESVFSGVVNISSVRLGFLITELNGLQVCTADIGNAFFYGRTKEKVYIKAGREFGSELEGKTMIVDKSLYGLRTSSARFHEHLSTKLLRTMGYTPTKADPDLWIIDKGTHYEYIARYVDDIIAFGKDPLSTINEVKRDYSILRGIGKPEYYLGGDVVELDATWHSFRINTGLSAQTYAKNIVEKYEKLTGLELRKYNAPMDKEYHPEADETDFLGEKDASLYRGLIGSANWMITLGRFDIAYATNTMARFGMKPRQGHLKAMLRFFGYIKKYQNGQLLVDANYMDWNPYKTEAHDWGEFYPDAEEELPPDMLTPKGKDIRLTCFKDADHAHDVVTRRSVTGFLLFANNMPIEWISNRQKTVETSTYGSELVASRIATDLIVEYRYKFRMLGVPVDGHALMLGDNASVIASTTIPSSPLRK